MSNRADEAMERLSENLRLLRDMRERLSAMLERVKADDELQDSSELIHVTGAGLSSATREHPFPFLTQNLSRHPFGQ